MGGSGPHKIRLTKGDCKMAVTIKQVEAIPASYPTVVPFDRLGYINADDAPTNEAQVWQRIEAYTAHRFSERSVIWTVEGFGDWEPPLTPVTIQTVEYWDNGVWQVSTPAPTPYGGLCFPDAGPWRVTANVGGGDVPAAVQEAFKRLHEYTRGINDSFKNETAMRQDGDIEMVANWTGKALQLSGAADLLRPYRRA